MTQPHPDAGFGVRPDALLEPDRRAPFRLPYDDMVQFGWRRLRDDVPELTLDTLARLDSALNARESWCHLGGDIAALADTQLTVRGFAHGVGPSAYEAIDQPVARQCAFVHRLNLWLTERRKGEGYVACLLQHVPAEGHGPVSPGLAAELADFRNQQRLLAEPAPLGPKAGVTTEPTAGPTRPTSTGVGGFLQVARNRGECGWQRGSDDTPCPKKPDHDEPHRCRSPYGDARWIDYDVTSELEVARSLAWTAELRQVDGPLEPMQVRDGDRAWIRGVLAYGRPEAVWVRADSASEVAGRWVDVIAATGDLTGETLSAYAAERGAAPEWVVVDSTSDPEAVRDSRYVLRPKPGSADLLARPTVTAGDIAVAFDVPDEALQTPTQTSVSPGDPGLEGKPARKPWRYIASEVAQAIGSHPEVQGPWLPGSDLTPLREVVRRVLVRELGDVPDVSYVRSALAMKGTAHTDATPGDTAVIADDDVDLAPDAGSAATAVGGELARQLGRPRDEHGHRHFDAQALAAAALQAVGVGQRAADRRMLKVDGQTIVTADGEEVIAMASARSWAQLLVDAWHTFPLVAEVDRNARGYGFEVGRGADPSSPVVEASPDNPFVSGTPARAHDGGTVPADVGWTPPLTAENAAELQGRGIDIVGAPITTPLCVCGHERAMHNEVPRLKQPLGCAVLSDLPHHDCPSFLAAIPDEDEAEVKRQIGVRLVADVARQLGRDPGPMLDRLEVLLNDEPVAHNGFGPPPGFNEDGHRDDCASYALAGQTDEVPFCSCASELLGLLERDGVIYGQAMVLRALAEYARRSTAEAVRAAMEGGWEPSEGRSARLVELGLA